MLIQETEIFIHNTRSDYFNERISDRCEIILSSHKSISMPQDLKIIICN